MSLNGVLVLSTVDIEDNAENVRDHVELAREQVAMADTRRGYCQCSKTKMMCWGLIVLIALVVVLSLVLSLK